MPVYLNTYETHQAYGGPEEGGWWYECGEPVQSVLLSSDNYEEWVDSQDPEQLTELRDRATLAFSNGQPPTPIKNGYGGYVFMPGDDTPSSYHTDNNYITVVEENYAEYYPESRPFYE